MLIFRSKTKRGEDMGTRIRAFLLMCLMAAAAYFALGAYWSIRSPWESELPVELYRSMLSESDGAMFFLRAQSGRVAVYPNRRGAAPEKITAIELSTLRAADRAMLLRGIPAADRQSLLMLLEDLGS